MCMWARRPTCACLHAHVHPYTYVPAGEQAEKHKRKAEKKAAKRQARLAEVAGKAAAGSAKVCICTSTLGICTSTLCICTSTLGICIFTSHIWFAPHISIRLYTSLYISIHLYTSPQVAAAAARLEAEANTKRAALDAEQVGSRT